MNFNKKRLDCFVIWGHGLQHKDSILEELHNESNFSIKCIFEHATPNIKKLVKLFHDHIPYRHLKKKTRYLFNTPSMVLFVFIENQDVREALYGGEKYLHLECLHINELKEKIRTRFNPHNEDGNRIEHHVVFATNNEAQTSKIIKYLGLGDDCRVFKNTSNILPDIPWHLRKIRKFQIKKVNLDQIKQRISSSKDKSFQLVDIAESLHYRYLKGESEGYMSYYKKGRGKKLKDPHFPKDFARLSDNLDYLGATRQTNYIVLKKISPQKYVIRDGSHRCAALYKAGKKTILVAVA